MSKKANNDKVELEPSTKTMKTLALNKKVKYDYEVLEKYEAGIILSGPEVKSAKLGQISLKGSYVTVKDGELWLLNCRISPYKKARQESYDPTKTRKLLLHRKEIDSILGKLKQKGLTLVPLRIYTKKRLIKVEFGFCRGKRKYEKRELIKEKEAKRKIERALRGKLE